MLYPVKERKIIIAGEKAILLWDNIALDGNRLKLYNYKVCHDTKGNKMYVPENSFKILEVSKKEALTNEVDYFVSCLKNGKKPENDEYSALKVMRFLERIKNAMHA